MFKKTALFLRVGFPNEYGDDYNCHVEDCHVNDGDVDYDIDDV